MKKVRFTESQMKHILGERYGTYLDSDSGSEVSDISYGTQVAVSDKNADGEYTDVLPSEKVRRVPVSPFARNRYFGGMTENRMQRLNEINSDFENEDLIFPREISTELAYALQRANIEDTGYKRLHNMVETGRVSASDAYRILHDYDNNKNYSKKSIIPRRAINWIRQNIKTLENTSRQHKEIKRAMGDNNAFQKSGGTRNNGGKAHTQKTSNGGTIRYF